MPSMPHDYFSGHAKDYAHYRPTYPPALFAYLRDLVKHRDCAWDCATGNGQAAVALAPYFKKVIATDFSQAQVDAAIQLPNIDYRVCPAEQTTLNDHSIDLITVAQALHWFDFTKFYAEVRRVAKPNAIFATWCYPMFSTNHPDISTICMEFYQTIAAPYWATERHYIDEDYRTIPFPFKEINLPAFIIEYQWPVQNILHYINTWSAVKTALKKINENLVDTWLKPRLEPFMQEIVTVRWSLPCRVGVVNDTDLK